MNYEIYVPGAPFQPGQEVVVVQIADLEICDCAFFIGKYGLVTHLNYDCGCGQTFPGEPMIGVLFPDGAVEEFWPEELLLFTTKEVSYESCQAPSLPRPKSIPRALYLGA